MNPSLKMKKVIKDQNGLILDTMITNEGSFIVGLLDLETNKLYHYQTSNIEDIDLKGESIVEELLKNIKSKKTYIITNCSLGYNLKVQRLFEEKKLAQKFSFNAPIISRIEKQINFLNKSTNAI